MDLFDIGMILLIVLSVASVMLETEDDIYNVWWREFFIFEAVSIAIFTVEYLLRLWSCVESPRYAGPLGRLRFASTPLAIVDLLAISPFYIHFLMPGTADLRFILSLRLLRIFRVLKLGRYSSAIAMLGRVIRSRRGELAVIFVLMMVTLVVAAGLMYYAERTAQPDKFSSIAASLWWAVITLTTIGYGDVYPITPLGKLLGGAIAVCGIGFVALPTAVVSAGFAEEVAARRRREEEKLKPHPSPQPELGAHPTSAPPLPADSALCPHCGKALALDLTHTMH